MNRTHVEFRKLDDSFITTVSMAAVPRIGELVGLPTPEGRIKCRVTDVYHSAFTDALAGVVSSGVTCVVDAP